MYLRRVQITGFKSFADKTMLELEPGITAVVGPNGSGKSNLADAVRWALGEQSRGRLRLSDREEVIFAGTTKRAKASFAEVVLVFNNDDGTFPLDLTEIEISRRLYRSGDGEYRLAGRSVRLGDIQSLDGTGRVWRRHLRRDRAGDDRFVFVVAAGRAQVAVRGSCRHPWSRAQP